MSVLLLACSMMEDEINKTLLQTNCNVPPHWMDRQLHRIPQKLQQELQTRIDASSADTILLVLGLCGNATVGLQSKKSRLVIPRFHDCIHILRSHTPHGKQNMSPRSLYQTRGWFEGEYSLLREYGDCLEKYGEELTRSIYHTLMKGYEEVVVLDTKSYDMPTTLLKAQQLAEVLQLELTVETGTTRVLKKLFLRQWDDEFIVKNPGEAIQMEDFFQNTGHQQDAVKIRI